MSFYTPAGRLICRVYNTPEQCAQHSKGFDLWPASLPADASKEMRTGWLDAASYHTETARRAA